MIWEPGTLLRVSVPGCLLVPPSQWEGTKHCFWWGLSQEFPWESVPAGSEQDFKRFWHLSRRFGSKLQDSSERQVMLGGNRPQTGRWWPVGLTKEPFKWRGLWFDSNAITDIYKYIYIYKAAFWNVVEYPYFNFFLIMNDSAIVSLSESCH